MSLRARRYRYPERITDIGDFKIQGNPRKMTKHHIPPRHPDTYPRIIKIDERHHRAYHLLFGNAGNFEDACKILKRDWWD